MAQTIGFILPRLLAISAAVLVLQGCGRPNREAENPVGNAPDFNYEMGQDLRSGMAALGRQLALLDRELLENEFNQIDKQEVIAFLREMEQIGSSLQATDAGELHAFLQDDMPVFLDALRNARLAAAASPPNYYLAGRVAGACVNCHRVNR